MKTFINNYKEPSFKTITGQGCKVKENIILKEVKETNKLYFARTFITYKQRLKEYFNIPLQVRFIRLSHHLSDEFCAKKELNKNITVKQSKYKDKTVIKVYTDIDSRFLNPINN